jgi:transcriptional regulator with XRE-family HTH domain
MKGTLRHSFAVQFLDLPSGAGHNDGMATDPHIGTRIRLARERKLWSQQQLADATGVDVKTVRNWEKTGRVRNRLGAIEAALGPLDDTPAGPSDDAEEALDRLQQQLDGLRKLLRERGQGNDEGGAGYARRAI